MKPTGLLCLALISGCAYGQTTFEVASVKPTPPPEDLSYMRSASFGGPGSPRPTRWTAENVSLMTLISRAYGLNPNQISGPGWLNDPGYDIDARVAEGASKDQFRLMLQDLLAKRFGLKAHTEQKDQPIYRLVPAKTGPKLAPSTGTPVSSEQEKPATGARLDTNGYPIPERGEGIRVSGRNSRTRMDGDRVTMEEFAKAIAGVVHRPVIEATGLPGKYDLVLYWTAVAESPEEPSGPSIYAALEQQLGLKLESAKGPVDILVVDHAERVPTGN